MLQKVISKKRYSLSGHVKTEEHIVKCSSESELLNALRGYSSDSEPNTTVSPSVLLSMFDSARPNFAMELKNSAGVTDNITVHTLH